MGPQARLLETCPTEQVAGRPRCGNLPCGLPMSRLQAENVRRIGMAWSGKIGGGLRVSLLAIALLLLGCARADAAYRLTFQNGTSFKVRSYEDLGDAIRYPRLGGTVTTPKANLSSIEEVQSAPATPAPPAPILPILHVPAQHTYAPVDLRVQIYGRLEAGAQTSVGV